MSLVRLQPRLSRSGTSGFAFALSWHEIVCSENPNLTPCRSASNHLRAFNTWAIAEPRTTTSGTPGILRYIVKYLDRIPSLTVPQAVQHLTLPPTMADSQVTLRTRKFIRNPLLGRKQMVV